MFYYKELTGDINNGMHDTIIRLNSGIFRIFELSAYKLNPIRSDCRASKIILNDTRVEPISWEPKREYPLFTFDVGVTGV